MTSLLHRCGEALYGPRWQTDLARDLGVSDRTMRRWAAGSNDFPDGVYADLVKLCNDRAAALRDLLKELRP